MKLDADEALRRLKLHTHGTCSTLHPERGIDSVPAVYAIDEDGYLGIPIDRVKPKTSTKLQRKSNLEIDPRATLLVDKWDDIDWGQLWWVRAHLEWQGESQSSRAATLSSLLAQRYPQYSDEPFERILVFRIAAITGWSAAN
mgnify:FL=1|jgi:hypothetical protein